MLAIAFPSCLSRKRLFQGGGQEAQERPFSDDPGHQLRPLAIAFPSCLSRKRLFQGSLGMLAMAFPPCLSRKRQFQGSAGNPPKCSGSS